MVKKILMLGESGLYERSLPVREEELSYLPQIIADLHDTLIDYGLTSNLGCMITAPQIGVKRRIIYAYFEEPVVFINPTLEFIGYEKNMVMDDCICFPHLEVRVKRYSRCRVKYRDAKWRKCEMLLEGRLSALMQHASDHLDGILSTTRAESPRQYFYVR